MNYKLFSDVDFNIDNTYPDIFYIIDDNINIIQMIYYNDSEMKYLINKNKDYTTSYRSGDMVMIYTLLNHKVLYEVTPSVERYYNKSAVALYYKFLNVQEIITQM